MMTFDAKCFTNVNKNMNSGITVSVVLINSCWKDNDTNFYRLRVTHKRNNRYIKTNILVHRDDFSRSGELRNREIRERIHDVQRAAEEIVINLDPNIADSMTIDEVADYIKKMSGGPMRLDIVKFGYEVAASKNTKSTADIYRAAIKSLVNYTNQQAIDVSRITSSFLRGWEYWLKDTYGERARAVSSYMSAFRVIHKEARLRFNNEELGYIPIKNPFLYYKPPVEQPARKRTIPEQIIQQMIDTRSSLAGKERLGVDVFLLSFAFMGMNAPDLYDCNLPKKGQITYYRQKTRTRRADKAEMHIRIEDCAIPIIKGHKASDGKHLFNFYKRFYSYRGLDQHVNMGLSLWCKHYGHDKITLYSARHTWATIAYRIGIDKGVINDCLCHVDREMKVTDIYIDKDWEVLWNANARVLSRFSWPAE